jgi:predicted ATPase with chaperone activity
MLAKRIPAIADLEGSPNIEPQHLNEAIQYRTPDRTQRA